MLGGMETKRSLTLWPSLALVTLCALLIGIPLAFDGFMLHPLWIARASLPAFCLAIGAGLLVRLAIHRFQTRRWPAFSRREWLAEAARLASALLTLMVLLGVYCWGKLLIPWFRSGVTFDHQLDAIERVLHFGIDPDLALLTALSGAAWLDRVIDLVYSQYPLVLMSIVGWFLTERDLDERHRWLRGFVLVWLGGLALYWLVPTLGPAFVFPDLAPILSKRYPIAFMTQNLLLENYVNLRGILDGSVALPLRIEYGIAAFPSLHVAVPAHAWLFASERKHPLSGPLLIVTLVFIIGSVATGWHYLIDAWGGLALATLCWLAFRKPRAAKALPR